MYVIRNSDKRVHIIGINKELKLDVSLILFSPCVLLSSP